MPKKLQKMANFQVYPTNLANPGRIGTIKMTLNIIFVLIIITHARGFESIKIFGGEGDLAAPYWTIIQDFLFDQMLQIEVVLTRRLLLVLCTKHTKPGGFR